MAERYYTNVYVPSNLPRDVLYLIEEHILSPEESSDNDDHFWYGVRDNSMSDNDEVCSALEELGVPYVIEMDPKFEYPPHTIWWVPGKKRQEYASNENGYALSLAEVRQHLDAGDLNAWIESLEEVEAVDTSTLNDFYTYVKPDDKWSPCLNKMPADWPSNEEVLSGG